MTSPEQRKQSAGLKPLDSYVAYLALQHSKDQEAIAAELALALYPLWSIQRFTELDRSTPLWLSATLPTVKTAYLQSQRVAAVFSDNVRSASLVDDPLPMRIPDVELPARVPAARFSLTPRGLTSPSSPRAGITQAISFDDFPISDVATSLAIQGNYEIKAQMPGPEEELMYNGLKNSAGAAIRQSMNGGRNAVDHVMQFDRKVIGYARVTDSDPCYFCALLASRGAVFGKGSFVKSDAKYTANSDAPDLPDGYSDVAKVHDHCKCQLRPVYAKSQSFDADAKFYRNQWNGVVKRNPDATNGERINIWRENYTPFERVDADVSELRKSLERRESALADAGYAPFSDQREWVAAQINQLAV